MIRPLVIFMSVASLSLLTACDLMPRQPNVEPVKPAIVSDPVYVNPELYKECLIPEPPPVVDSLRKALAHDAALYQALVECSNRNVGLAAALRRALNQPTTPTLK